MTSGFKHTPGPWIASTAHTGKTIWRVESDAEGYPNDGWIVADALGPDAEYNAHLMAAAPEMVEVIKLACEEIEYLRRWANNHGAMHESEQFKEGLAVIAKIEGK